jgi:hypothetical protein
MGNQGWRIPLALLLATVWGWNPTIAKLFEMRPNPGLYPMWLWAVLIGIDVVLLAIDVWAVLALVNFAFAALDNSDNEPHQSER